MNFNKILEEIKTRLDIVETISEYIDLKKSGQNYKTLCPFHTEKTPSFFVSPSKQIFHCFGCGKGGDIVSFVMEYEKVSFVEALSILAKKAGVDFKTDRESISTSFKENLYRIYEEALSFFNEQLKTSDKAKRYLRERGIREDTAEIFQLGYAPLGKDLIWKHLKNKGFDEKIIKNSGLITSIGEDFFRDRLIIPIHNLSGRVIGFGGRLIQNDSSAPKYINSPDTPIFRKGENLFGLFHAKTHIKKKNYVILVEGYMDVILCHQFGFRNTVAPLGTSITLEQLKKLKKFTNKILLIFDGDEAGVLAAQRSMSSLFEAGFIVKIVLLPNEEDPASLLKKLGSRGLKEYISKAISPVELFIDFGKGNQTDKIHNFLLALSFLRDLIYREELIKKLSEKTLISEIALREELKQLLLKKKNNKVTSIKREFSIPKEEEILLGIVMSFPDRVKEIENLDIDHFENQTVKSIFSKIIEICKIGAFSLHSLLNILNEDEKSLISKAIIETEFEENDINQILRDCIKKLYIKNIDKKIKEVAKTGNERALSELMKKRKELL